MNDKLKKILHVSKSEPAITKPLPFQVKDWLEAYLQAKTKVEEEPKKEEEPKDVKLRTELSKVALSLDHLLFFHLLFKDIDADVILCLRGKYPLHIYTSQDVERVFQDGELYKLYAHYSIAFRKIKRGGRQ